MIVPIEEWMRESGWTHPQVFALATGSSFVGMTLAIEGELEGLTIEEWERIVSESGYFELMESLDGKLPL